MVTTRRSFLSRALHPVALMLSTARKHRASPLIQELSRGDTTQFKNQLLGLANTERLSAGARTLVMDDLAGGVADQHALDMATGKFLSHWGSDGRKPYHRYCRAGGFASVQENVSMADELTTRDPKFIALTLAQMHIKMHAEVPPNDGHKRAILAPQHTHAGFGIALIGNDLRLVELYIARYIQLEPFQRLVKRRAIVQLDGKILSRDYRLSYAEVFYEPPPMPPEISWLREPRPYSLPAEYKAIRRVTPTGTEYADGVKGVIETGSGGRFRIPVTLYKNEPGIYTVVIWISDKNGRNSFAATNICVEAE